MDNISMQLIGGADGPTSVFLAGILNTQILIAIVVIGLLLCVLGLKLMRVLSALVGFGFGVGIGAAISMIAGVTGTAGLALIIGPGIVFAALAGILRKAGVFISVFFYVVTALSSIIPSVSLVVLIIELVVGIVAAVFAVKYMEPAVVIASSLAGGMLAGPAIVELIGFADKAWLGYVIGFVLAVLGMLIQGIMQSRKVGKNEKNYARKIKETDSMESEVEKARMLLDEEDDI